MHLRIGEIGQVVSALFDQKKKKKDFASYNYWQECYAMLVLVHELNQFSLSERPLAGCNKTVKILMSFTTNSILRKSSEIEIYVRGSFLVLFLIMKIGSSYASVLEQRYS